MSKVLHFSHRKNSGRIIVDEYDQIRKERDEYAVCRFCRNEIPSRLIVSLILWSNHMKRYAQPKLSKTNYQMSDFVKAKIKFSLAMKCTLKMGNVQW
jgi:hypothetical protein